MIFTDRGLNSREWLARIDNAVFFHPDSNCRGVHSAILYLRLKDDHGQDVELWLDEDSQVRFLEPAIGEFKDSEEITGKHVVAILDRHGDVVTFQKPLPYNFELQHNQQNRGPAGGPLP